MEKRKGCKSEEKEQHKWVRDASVDYKGRVPLRAATGVDKASLFVFGKIHVYLCKSYLIYELKKTFVYYNWLV